MLTQNALTVLEKRYLRKNVEGKTIETPLDMFRRVSYAIASAEKNYGASEDDIKKLEDKFFNAISNLEFLPNSPTLMNAGYPNGQLSACFVIPVPDSTDGIFDAVKIMAITQKSGGGTGFSFTDIRPRGDVVKTTGGTASGPISFMKIFDAATEEIRQGGRRRGANMGILNVNHPDIIDFITAKDKEGILQNFNISVAITDKFMEALEKDGNYELINPHDNLPVKELKAKSVWDLIVKMAWKNGEPGIVFIDRINEYNPTPTLGEIKSTNPCGEVPLLPYESCNLASINLTRFVTSQKTLDYDKLKKTVELLTRFLDDVIDVNTYPFDTIAKSTRLTRKIGLGVMGFADMLYMLGIPYNSDEAIVKAEKIMSFINKTAIDYSIELGKKRGSFPYFHESIYKDLPAFRNATLTTIAPTGSISIIAGCSSGIEPNFALAYTRRIMDNTLLTEVNPIFEKVAKERGFYSEELMKEVVAKGSIKDIPDIPDDVKNIFIVSHDIRYEWHVKMQAAFQKSTNNSVSKTINFPEDATQDDIKKAYLLAYKTGCKGITVYRDNSRAYQTLSKGETKETKDEKTKHELHEIKPELKLPRARPEVTKGITQKVNTGCGNLYITINEDKDGLCEVFAAIGKSGGCAAASTEAICRLISLTLRSGVDVDPLIKQLKGIRCPSPVWNKGELILSCEDAIARTMERYMNDNPKSQKSVSSGGTAGAGNLCPDCGQTLELQEGCATCHSCGFSKCG